MGAMLGDGQNTHLTNTLWDWRVIKSRDGLSVVESESGVIDLMNG